MNVLPNLLEVRAKLLCGWLFFFVCTTVTAQEADSLSTHKTTLIVEETVKEPYDPLAPSRAAFYSAVVPGLGQIYNKKYWKLPIIYGGMATSLYFYIDNNNDYHRYRDAYKRRLAGYEDDEFQGISNETLIRAQQTSRRNRDTSMAITIGIYLLNIIDANVDAHLRQFNVSDDLTLHPNVNYDSRQATTNYTLSLTYKLQ